MKKQLFSDDYILMKGNVRKMTQQNPFLNFLELLKLIKLIFFCFGVSIFGHVTVLFLKFLKDFLYYFKGWDIMKKG